MVSEGTSLDRSSEKSGRLNSEKKLDELGETLLKLLEEEIESGEIKIMKRPEGRGYGYYIRIPSKWAEKFGLKTLMENKKSIETKAIADFSHFAITVKIPRPSNEDGES